MFPAKAIYQAFSSEGPSVETSNSVLLFQAVKEPIYSCKVIICFKIFFRVVAVNSVSEYMMFMLVTCSSFSENWYNMVSQILNRVFVIKLSLIFNLFVP